MGNPQLGLIILGSIVGLLTLLAIVITFGKKFHDEKQSNNDS